MGRWGRRFGIGAAVGLPLAVLACNALSGAGDLTFGTCETCGDVDARGSDGSGDGGMVLVDASIDGGLDAKVDAIGMRPSFCDGIVMYARFDGTLATAQGVSPDAPPAKTFVPGHFGMGVLLTGPGSGMYYAAGDGGVPYSSNEGTFAMWLKPQWTWPPTVQRIFWKPVADRAIVSANAAGPFIIAQVMAGSSFFGGYNNEPATSTVTSAGGNAAEFAPYWKADWNHVVETWSRSAPTISFTLNGADGDASVTRRETGGSWVAEAPAVAYVRLASGQYPSDSAYDDVVMWSRSLSLAEIQAVYNAGVPVGDLCGL